MALKMGKEIWVLSHRLDESLGTNQLLAKGKANVIQDVESFVSRFGQAVESEMLKDDFFYFCQRSPTFDETVKKFGDKVYEAELEGMVTIHNGIVTLQ